MGRWLLSSLAKVSDAGKCALQTESGCHDLEILITAAEAYPRLESLFLGAQNSISMGFRLFDPRTKLRSKAARKTGDTWADLFLHTLNRGVPINLTVSDFDPVMAHEMHEQAWQFVAISEALNELSAPGAAHLTVRCIRHPAKGGIFPRLMFATKTRKELRQIAKAINASPDRLRFSPGLVGLLSTGNDQVNVRYTALPELYPVTLHHKMAVFDSSVTYIGGLDLNERRVDDQKHIQPSQETWHDVQLISHDPKIATDALQFLTNLKDTINGNLPVPSGASAFRTTLSRKRTRNTFHLSPETISDSILKEHLLRIRDSRQLIYLESQYFRDRRIAAALAQAGKYYPDLCLLILLPAAPETAAFDDAPGLDARYGEYLQARALRRVRRAFGNRFLAVSPVQPRKPDGRDKSTKRATLANAPIIYNHSKVSIFDDSAAIVSSANLNGRSMKWDAETGILLTDPAQVTALKQKVFGHWLGTDLPSATFDQWLERALNNANLPPDQRSGFIVPHDLKPAAQIGTPIPGAPEEMV